MNGYNDGGPAFPIPIAGCNDGGVYNALEQSAGKLGGMSLRDYFAAKAMQTIASDPAKYAEYTNKNLAIMAYRLADAMLAAREATS